MLDPAAFRTALPEFADATRYPDPVVQLQLTVAYTLLREDVWGSMLDTAAGWVAAHFLVLATKTQSAAAAGRAPGAVTGVQASKSVDKVSVSYDTKASTNEDAAFWNLTSYGVQFLWFARMFGAGGVQL